MEEDFDGCTRACRRKGEHTLVWGQCELAPEPEPTVSLSKVFTDTDGRPSVGFDVYAAEELAEDLIEPVLRDIRMQLGPELAGAVLRGEPVRPFADEEGGMQVARWIARAIIRRNDPPKLIPLPGIPVHGVDCPCPPGKEA